MDKKFRIIPIITVLAVIAVGVFMTVKSVKSNETESVSSHKTLKDINDKPAVIGGVGQSDSVDSEIETGEESIEVSDSSMGENNEETTSESIDESESVSEDVTESESVSYEAIESESIIEDVSESAAEPMFFTIYLEVSDNVWISEQERVKVVEFGKQFELIAPLKQGYNFLYWKDKNSDKKYYVERKYTYNLTENLYLIPIFE